jgi:hypothetical protein
MINLLLSVTEPASGDYQVALFKEDTGGTWPLAPLASGAIPRQLNPAKAPAAIGPGLVAEQICQYVHGNSHSAVFDSIGEYLAGLLLPDDIGECWGTIRREHPEGVRTLLQIEPDDLRLLPWELMSLDGSLFTDPASLLVRFRPRTGDLPRPSEPIRVLVVEGQCDQDDPLGMVAEVRAIKHALSEVGGRIEAVFLSEPSEKDLKETYDLVAPHIFHFIGHGMHAAKTGEAALRVFNRSKGSVWPLTSRHVRELLRPAPRVAIMNACRSGEVADVRSLTEAFLSRETVAVIGMQGDIRGQAAAMFGGGLYRALADGQPLDEAVTRARHDLYVEVGVTAQRRDWFLPSLTLRVRPEHVLPETCELYEKQWRQAESRQQLQPFFQAFVDRVDHRYKLVRGAAPGAGKDPGRLLVVRGDLSVGKSSLLHWIRRRCALSGRRVRYVDFRGDSKLDLIGALCAIRDAEEDLPALSRPAANAFDRFTYDLSYLASGRLPRDPAPGTVPHVDHPPVPALQAGPVDLVSRMLESFRDALGAATAQSPLILILDHLDGLPEPTFTQQLYPQLIRKVADEDDIPGLRLIVALKTDEVGTYWPADDDRYVGEWIDIGLSDPADYESLAEDVVLALGADYRQTHEDLIRAMKPFMPVKIPWKLKELDLLQDVVRKMLRSAHGAGSR